MEAVQASPPPSSSSDLPMWMTVMATHMRIWTVLLRQTSCNLFSLVVAHVQGLEFLAATCLSRTGRELKETLTKTAELNILITSLLLGSTVGMINSGIDVDEFNESFAHFVEVCGVFSSMACLAATLGNVMMIMTLNAVGEANVSVWVMANTSYVTACNRLVAVSCYTFAVSLLVYGLAATTAPVSFAVAWAFGFAIAWWVVLFLGSPASFMAVHSGSLADTPVIPPASLPKAKRVKDVAIILQMLADKAIESTDGDWDAMVALYQGQIGGVAGSVEAKSAPEPKALM